MKKSVLTILFAIIVICFASSAAAVNNSAPVAVFIPDYNPNVKVNSNFLFSLTKSDADNDTLNVNWMLDDINISSEDNYTLNISSPGSHNLTAIVSDNSSNVSKTWNVNIVDKPAANSFDPSITTNFSAISDLTNVSNLSIGNSNGLIVFKNNTDLSSSVDFDNGIVIKNGFVSVDTGILPGISGKMARISMNNVNSSSKPKIKVTFDNLTENNDCESAGLCKNVSWNGNVLEFDAEHFSSFEALVTKPEFESKLLIDRIRVKKDGKKATASDGETVDNIKPGTDLEIEIEIRNSGSLDIHDVEVKGEIEDIDDGSEIDDISSEFDLDAGEDDKVTLEFKIPFNADSVAYPLTIMVDGQDADGNVHKTNATVFLLIEKKSHELAISRLSVNNAVIECSRRMELTIKVNNIGENEEDDVTIKVFNSELGIDIIERAELEEGSADDDDDSYFQDTYLVNVPDLQTGEYRIKAEAYYDEKLSDEEDIEVFVGICIETKSVNIPARAEQQDKEIEVLVAEQIVSTDYAPGQIEEDDSIVIALMVSGLVVLAGLAAFASMLIIMKK